MADKLTSALTAIGTPAVGDLIPIHDIDDTTELKSATLQNIFDLYKDLTITVTNKTINTASNTITINEADISDLQAYLLDVSGSPLSQLSDVTITAISSGEILKWNGSAWINNTLAEAGVSATGHTHTESDITDLQTYLTTITGSPLSDLSDVTITGIGANEILKWNGSAWINNTLAEAGVSATGHTHVEADITDLQAYDVVVGTQTKFIPAAALYPAGTSAANGPVTKIFGANNQPINAIEFPDGSDTYCYLDDVLENWDAGTIKVKLYWFRENDEASPESQTMEIEVSGVSLANFGAIGGTAYGTAVAVTDTTDGTAAEDKINITAASTAITIAGAGAGEWVSLRFMRDDSAGSMTGSLFLAGVGIEYTISGGTSTL